MASRLLIAAALHFLLQLLALPWEGLLRWHQGAAKLPPLAMLRLLYHEANWMMDRAVAIDFCFCFCCAVVRYGGIGWTDCAPCVVVVHLP